MFGRACQQKFHCVVKILPILFCLTIPHQTTIIYIVKEEKEIIYIAKLLDKGCEKY